MTASSSLKDDLLDLAHKSYDRGVRDGAQSLVAGCELWSQSGHLGAPEIAAALPWLRKAVEAMLSGAKVRRVRGPHVYEEDAVPPSNCRPEPADGRPVPTSWNPKP